MSADAARPDRDQARPIWCDDPLPPPSSSLVTIAAGVVSLLALAAVLWIEIGPAAVDGQTPPLRSVPSARGSYDQLARDVQ